MSPEASRNAAKSGDEATTIAAGPQRSRQQRRLRSAAGVVGGLALGGGLVLATGLTAGAAAPTSAADDRSKPSGRCSTAVENRNLAAFERYLDDLMSGDAASAQALFADGAEVEIHGSVPIAGTYPAVGEEYLAVQSGTFGPPVGDAAEPPRLWADCDQVILQGAFVRDVPSTGERLDTTVIEFFTFEDGRITRDDFWFGDTAAVNEALTAD